jgi:hypothetical protein
VHRWQDLVKKYLAKSEYDIGRIIDAISSSDPNTHTSIHDRDSTIERLFRIKKEIREVIELSSKN